MEAYDQEPPAKRQRLMKQSKNSANMSSNGVNGADLDLDLDGIDDSILDLIDDAPEMAALDSNGLRDLVGRFQKCLTKNEEMRAKYGDDPTKFMESEIELDSIIHDLTQQLPTQPHLYKDFVLMKGVTATVKLLFHENLDIAVSAIGFLREMTEPDSYQEAETAITFVAQFLKHNGCKILLENLQRLNDPNVVEPKKGKKKTRFKPIEEGGGSESKDDEMESAEDDYDSIYAILAIIENICDIDEEGTFRIELVRQSKILKTLLNMIRTRLEYGKEFSEISLYCSELICILLQTSDSTIIFPRFAEIKGNDKILHLLNSKYSSKDPALSEEKEFVSNLLDALSFSLVSVVNQDWFCKSPVAMKHLLALIRSKLYVKQGALKALSYALMNHKGNCLLLVDQKGLGTIFACFMKNHVKKKYKHSHNLDEMEEYVVSILVQLFVYLSDVNLARLIGKFKEKNYEKIDRLIDLHCKYWNRIEENDLKTLKSLEKNKNESSSNGNNIGQELPSERFERRMEIGLATLQMIDVLISFVYTLKHDETNTRIEQVLSRYDNDLDTVKDIIKEFAIVSKDDDLDQTQEMKQNNSESGNDANERNETKKTNEDEPDLGAIAAKLYQLMDQMS